MIEKVFLNEVKIPETKSVYELVKEEHSHLVCKSCGKIEDVIIDTSPLQSSLYSKSNFKVENIEVVFSGVCENCAK